MASRAFNLQGDILEACLNELSPPPARVVVVPGGEAVWDSCCDGMLYSALGNISPKQAGAKCVGWTASIKVGVIRCCHVVDDYGNSPAPHEISKDAETMLDDMVALMRALAGLECVMSIDSWDALEPNAGCAGGEWTISVHLPLEESLPVE